MLNSTSFVHDCISLANHSAAILRAYQSCGLVIWRGVAFYRSLFISQTTLSAMNPGFKLFTLSLKCLLKIQNEAVLFTILFILRCGEVFCGKCSQYRRRLSVFGTPDPNGFSYRVRNNI